MNISPSHHESSQHNATQTRRVFLTFGDRRLRKTLRRIRREAEEMGVFDEIRVWDERDLSPAFRKRWADKLRSTVRGFGYWVWKPEIILRTLDDMKEGEILLYADAGCKLVKTGRARLEDYFRMTEETPLGIVATLLPEVFPDRDWCKGDLMDYLGVRNRPDILDSAQIQSGTLFIRKNPNSIAFLKRWAALWDTDFALIDDSPSHSPNLPGFREHRHDQSALSLLLKRGGHKNHPGIGVLPAGKTSKRRTKLVCDGSRHAHLALSRQSLSSSVPLSCASFPLAVDANPWPSSDIARTLQSHRLEGRQAMVTSRTTHTCQAKP